MDISQVLCPNQACRAREQVGQGNIVLHKRLASLTRKSRHAARVQTLQAGIYLLGYTYNFCLIHWELSKENRCSSPCTPAKMAGSTDHLRSLRELLGYRIAPTPWCGAPRFGRSFPHPGLGSVVELGGGHLHGPLDLIGVSKALTGKPHHGGRGATNPPAD
ncbi:MAG TPA: hypothetical protein VH593_16095 [Ktedonobacteraceae bacterium]